MSGYKAHLREVLINKIGSLKNQYSVKRSIPNSVHGIVIADQSIPNDISTAPQWYGGVVMNKNQLAALWLPPKFIVYSGIDEADCEAQVKKGLAKLRCSVSRQESQAGEPVEVEEQTSFRTGVNSFDFC